MNLNNINIIKKIESEVFSNFDLDIKKYKKFNKLWIDSSMSLAKIKRDQVPGIQFYPNSNYKYWLRYVAEIFNKKESRKTNIEGLLGLYLSWYFLKKSSAVLKADYIYEYLSLVMFYTEEKYLIKTCHSDYPWHEGIKKEVRLQSFALKIVESNNLIGLPKIIRTVLDSNQPYFIQELISGKDINRIGKKRKLQIYGLVFETMFSIYRNSDVKLLKRPLTIDYNFVEKLRKCFKSNGKRDIFEEIKNILKKDLLLPFCFLHADLKGNNIIVDSHNKIWIIDWLGAKENYMVFELDNDIINLKKSYEQFIIDSNFSKEQLYDFNEQIILKKLILLQNQLNFGNVNTKKVALQFKELEDFVLNIIMGNK